MRHDDTTVLNGDIFKLSDWYSNEITELARGCLNWYQDERPTLHNKLEQAIKSLSEPGSKIRLKGCKNLQFSLPNHKEEFKIGEVVATITDDDDDSFDIE
jgi:hypothetical protein